MGENPSLFERITKIDNDDERLLEDFVRLQWPTQLSK